MVTGRFLFILFYSATFFSYGQDSVVTEETHKWLQYYSQFKLSDNQSIVLDGGFRTSKKTGEDDISSKKYLLRGGFSYAVKKHLCVLAGIAYLGSTAEVIIDGNKNVDQKFHQREVRPYQEVSNKSKIGTISLNQRIRSELRICHSKILDEGASYYKEEKNYWRFRYLVNFGIPLWSFNQKQDKQLLLNLGNEILINSGQVIDFPLDQNRILISPTYEHSKNLSISPTWSMVYGAKNDRNILYKNQVVWLQIRQKFDLEK